MSCNKQLGGKMRKNQTMKLKGGGNSDLQGSEYTGMDSGVLQEGTPFVGFDVEAGTDVYAGSYAPLSKGVHQCGGGNKRRRNLRTKSRKNSSKRIRRRTNLNKKSNKRKTARNKSRRSH